MSVEYLTRFIIDRTWMIADVQKVFVIITAGDFGKIRLGKVYERHSHVAHFLSRQKP